MDKSAQSLVKLFQNENLGTVLAEPEAARNSIQEKLDGMTDDEYAQFYGHKNAEAMLQYLKQWSDTPDSLTTKDVREMERGIQNVDVFLLGLGFTSFEQMQQRCFSLN